MKFLINYSCFTNFGFDYWCTGLGEITSDSRDLSCFLFSHIKLYKISFLMTMMLYFTVFMHSFFPKFKDFTLKIQCRLCKNQNQVTPIEAFELTENSNPFPNYGLNSNMPKDYVRYLIFKNFNNYFSLPKSFNIYFSFSAGSISLILNAVMGFGVISIKKLVEPYHLDLVAMFYNLVVSMTWIVFSEPLRKFITNGFKMV